MIVSVHQPQYMPWLGYFDKIDRSDLFVFLDTVQYKKNEFQNRNRIKNDKGWQWLTVPVGYRFPQKIDEVTVNENMPWRHKHRQALITNYGKAPYFEACFSDIEGILENSWSQLTELNVKTVEAILNQLGIKTSRKHAGEWQLDQNPTGRLVDICLKSGADTYLSGAGGQNYLDLDQFETEGISVIFQDFEHPQYTQQFGDFEPFMSTLDLLFNCGTESLNVIRKGR
jgi:hypothetical protein